MGPEDRREDPPHPGARPAQPGADDLPGRLGRRPHHRPGADVPRPPRRRAHLPQPGPPLGPGAAGLPAVRPQRRRRRLHPRLLRRRDHARRQRLDVPGLAADGADGDRRGGDAGGDGRGPHAHGNVGLRTLPGRERRRRDRPRQALPLVHALELARAPAGRAARRAGVRGAVSEIVPDEREGPLRRRRADRGGDGRGLVPGGPGALGQGARGRLRASRRQGDRDRRKPAEGQGRRAVRGLGRQGRPLHLGLQRLQPAAALPRRRARLHDRQGRRAPGDHPPRRQDDQRRLRGDRAEDLGDRAQGLRRRPLRDGRPGLRARLLHRLSPGPDRRDGPRGGHQRRLLQPDPGDRATRPSARPSSRPSARSTPRTSTSSTSPPSWSSTP